MTKNKFGSLKAKLESAMKKNRVAPRWIIVKKYGLKRGVHVSSWTLNPKMRRNWRKTKIGINR
ncbi:MAG: 50S ribosomal protein L39e [Candidatus Nanoarchaeia archaeon]|jgi:ribosomal protein L39E